MGIREEEGGGGGGGGEGWEKEMVWRFLEFLKFILFFFLLFFFLLFFLQEGDLVGIKIIIN